MLLNLLSQYLDFDDNKILCQQLMCLLSMQIVYYSLGQLTQKDLAKLNFLGKKVSIHVHLVSTPEDLGAILINLIKSQANVGVNHESLLNEANEDHAHPWERNLEDREMNS